MVTQLKARRTPLPRNRSPIRYILDHQRDMANDPESLGSQFIYDTVFSLKANKH